MAPPEARHSRLPLLPRAVTSRTSTTPHPAACTHSGDSTPPLQNVLAATQALSDRVLPPCWVCAARASTRDPPFSSRDTDSRQRTEDKPGGEGKCVPGMSDDAEDGGSVSRRGATVQLRLSHGLASTTTGCPTSTRSPSRTRTSTTPLATPAQAPISRARVAQPRLWRPGVRHA